MVLKYLNSLHDRGVTYPLHIQLLTVWISRPSEEPTYNNELQVDFRKTM